MSDMTMSEWAERGRVAYPNGYPHRFVAGKAQEVDAEIARLREASDVAHKGWAEYRDKNVELQSHLETAREQLNEVISQRERCMDALRAAKHALEPMYGGMPQDAPLMKQINKALYGDSYYSSDTIELDCGCVHDKYQMLITCEEHPL